MDQYTTKIESNPDHGLNRILALELMPDSLKLNPATVEINNSPKSTPSRTK
uniref:Uncharacterized protein n=1 Tax=Arundo donax TaxID=35708 RepID=A0A0A8ZPM3_ARUDO